MGLGLYLLGDSPRIARDPHAFLTEVGDWIVDHCVDELIGAADVVDRDAGPALSVRLHPAAEEVELQIREGRLRLMAKTSTVGPGYHAYLCDVASALAAANGVAWEPADTEEGRGDETGYFDGADLGELEQHMLRLLQGLAGYALRTERSAEAPILLCMAIDHGYSFPAEVLTPMGPRDRAWLERVSVKPDEGSDFFAWWERGGGPRSLRDRALAHMWTDVCWRPPVDEDELLLQERVVELLARAHAGDPTLDFPWREWNELLDHVGTDDDDLAELVAARAGEVRGPRIGYRRHPVTVHVGSGWSIRIPGALRERWEDDSTWLAYDETHTVRLTTFAVGDDAASPEEVLERMERPAGELIEHRTDGLLGWATLDTERDEDGEHLLLQGYTAVAGGLALTTIVVPDAAHVGWAVDTWRSVRGPAPTPPAD